MIAEADETPAEARSFQVDPLRNSAQLYYPILIQDWSALSIVKIFYGMFNCERLYVVSSVSEVEMQCNHRSEAILLKW